MVLWHFTWKKKIRNLCDKTARWESRTHAVEICIDRIPERFAPSMDYQVLYGKTSEKLSEDYEKSDVFLTITTYGMVSRIQALKEREWDCIILDEAQTIKNPLTKQTKEIKKLQTRMRIAMTGTPIENNLTNLWSLFDFLNKGLMGTSKEFKEYCKTLKDYPEGYAKLKQKQICNHPDQYLGQQAYIESESGKFAMLKELCETIYEKRERVLIFTQFEEITEYLAQ